MTEFTEDFKINVNKLNADEALLVCLEIDHPFINEPVRVVNDSVKIISNGNTFLPIGFDVKRQDDVEGELPRVVVNFPNVGRLLTKWVDQSGGGRDASFKVLVIRRSNPDVIEELIELGVHSVVITTLNVQFNLVVQNNLIKRSVNYFFDKKRAPGLF